MKLDRRLTLLAAVLAAVATAHCSEPDYEGQGERDLQREKSDRHADVPRARPGSFMGHECKDDCSGHEAGYEWASSEGIDNPEDCPVRSESFSEGCEEAAKEGELLRREERNSEY